MFLPGTILSDGEWHRIEIKWLGSDLSVGIDYGSRVTLLPMSANKIQGLYVGKILLGGPDSLSIGSVFAAEYGYFEGCIQVITLNKFRFHHNIIWNKNLMSRFSCNRMSELEHRNHC